MKATLSLILICVIVYGYLGFVAPDKAENIVERYGFSGNNLLSHPEVLVTSIFIHADLEHLLANILILFFFGTAVEAELGRTRMLGIFLLGAVAGDIFSLLIYPLSTISVGASGGIFALIGTGMLVRPFDFSFYPYFMPIPLGLLGVMYATYNAIGFVTGTGNISYIAHFGGLFTGLYFGFQREGWEKGLRTIMVMFVIMILIPYVWVSLPRVMG